MTDNSFQKCISVWINCNFNCVKIQSHNLFYGMEKFSHMISFKAWRNANLKEKKIVLVSPRRGIEPRSPAWQAGILTTILTRIQKMFTNSDKDYYLLRHGKNTVTWFLLWHGKMLNKNEQKYITFWPRWI